jgi:PKD repeat protein
MGGIIEGSAPGFDHGWAWYGDWTHQGIYVQGKNSAISSQNSKIKQWVRMDGSATQKMSLTVALRGAFNIYLDGVFLFGGNSTGQTYEKVIPPSYTGEVLVECRSYNDNSGTYGGEAGALSISGVASAGVRAYANTSLDNRLAGFPIQFTDATDEFVNTSWSWNFGDGQTSMEQNPVHTYANAGEYTAILTTENGTKKVLVNLLDQTPVVIVTTINATGAPPLTKTFTASGSNFVPGSGTWNFGDGESIQADSASHTYNVDGVFPVSFTVTYGGKTVTKTGTVTVHTPKPPIVDFSATPRDGLTVDFEDLSENSPTGWTWDFGEDPLKIKKTAHTYAVPGTYNVKLTATNTDGSVAKTKSIAVTVSDPVNPLPVANFSSVAPVPSASLSLSFTDLSTNTPSSWLWDFGDGTTSTLKSPSHSYAIAGTYQVKLTATNENGSSDVTKVTVVTAPVIPPASWSVSPEVVPVSTTARITLSSSGFKTGSKIRITQPENIGIVSKIISFSSTQILFEFNFDESFLGVCGISVIPTSGTPKIFTDAITVV